jgi:hypothetical protein
VYLAGAAAALVSNPILLQLGVITGKKRRRRESDADVSYSPDPSAQEAEAVQQKLNEIALLERFIAQVNILKISILFSRNKKFRKELFKLLINNHPMYRSVETHSPLVV